MNRIEKLEKIFADFDEDTKSLLAPILKDAAFLETQLEEYKKFPFISVNPKNPVQQKTTPAAKLYKETVQQYTNIIKLLLIAVRRDGEEESSPLREYLQSIKG